LLRKRIYGCGGSAGRKKSGCVYRTYYRSSDEPSRVAYRIKESESLVHSVLRKDKRYLTQGEEPQKGVTHDTLILVQHLIILAQSHQKHERGHVLKTMNPLLPLAPLTPDVHELIRQLPDFERRLGDARRFDSGAEDILVGRDIVRGSQAIDDIKVVYGTVVELELSRTADSCFDSGISPEVANGVGDGVGKESPADVWRERKYEISARCILR